MNFPPILYLLLIIPMVLSWWAQSRVQKIFKELDQTSVASEVTGMEVAKEILLQAGLGRVGLEIAGQRLGDYYDPARKTIRLSAGTAWRKTVTAIGVAGHEAAHAIQDAQGYGLMRFRNMLGGALMALSTISPFAFIGGFLLGSRLLMWVALIIMALQALFALLTFPLERNASRRALGLLRQNGLVRPEEEKDVGRVLRAASYTYLAAAAQRLAFFLFWFVLVAGTLQVTRSL